jgi:hypothetical protein
MIGSRMALTAASAVLIGLAAVGCKSNKNGGEVTARTQDQTVQPDGTAVQTRTQVRETPSGETVRETQTQTRQPISPGSGTSTGTTGTTSGTTGGTTGTGTSR